MWLCPGGHRWPRSPSRGRVHRRRRLAVFAGLSGATCRRGHRAGPRPDRRFRCGPRPQHRRDAARGLHPHQLCQRHRLAEAEPGVRPGRAAAGTRAPRHPGSGQDQHLLLVQPGGTRPRRPPGAWSTPRGMPDIVQSGNWPVKPSQLAPSVDPITMVLNPAAMPSGTELFIGNFDLGNNVFVGRHLHQLPHLHQRPAASRSPPGPAPVSRARVIRPPILAACKVFAGRGKRFRSLAG